MNRRALALASALATLFALSACSVEQSGGEEASSEAELRTRRLDIECTVTKLYDDNIFEEGLASFNDGDEDSQTVAVTWNEVRIGQYRFTHGEDGVTMSSRTSGSRTALTMADTAFGALKLDYNATTKLVTLRDETHLVAEADCSDEPLPYYFPVALNGRAFSSTSLSIYPDGLSSRTDARGVDIALTGAAADYTVDLTTEGEATCRVARKTVKDGIVTIRVETDLEIDDGSCDVKITRVRDGRTAVVAVSNIGS